MSNLQMMMALRKQITAMYEIAAVLKSEDFNNIGTAARKSITRLLKKLTYYEQKAHATMLTGEDTLITLEQVRETVSWAMHGLCLLRFIHDKSAYKGGSADWVPRTLVDALRGANDCC